ncbi:hypothetical protein ACWGDX_00970 [Streptomyces sp. NPDC055025]
MALADDRAAAVLEVEEDTEPDGVGILKADVGSRLEQARAGDAHGAEEGRCRGFKQGARVPREVHDAVQATSWSVVRVLFKKSRLSSGEVAGEIAALAVTANIKARPMV